MNEDTLRLYELCTSVKPKIFAQLTQLQREDAVLQVQGRILNRSGAFPDNPGGYIHEALRRAGLSQLTKSARRGAILEGVASQGVGTSATLLTLSPEQGEAHIRTLFDHLLEAALQLRVERYREGLRVAAEELWSVVRAERSMQELIADHMKSGETRIQARNRLLTRHKRVRQAMAEALAQMALGNPPPKELDELRRLHDRLLRCQRSPGKESVKP